MVFCEEPIPDSETCEKRSSSGRKDLAEASFSILRLLNDDH